MRKKYMKPEVDFDILTEQEMICSSLENPYGNVDVDPDGETSPRQQPTP